MTSARTSNMGVFGHCSYSKEMVCIHPQMYGVLGLSEGIRENILRFVSAKQFGAGAVSLGHANSCVI